MIARFCVALCTAVVFAAPAEAGRMTCLTIKNAGDYYNAGVDPGLKGFGTEWLRPGEEYRACGRVTGRKTFVLGILTTDGSGEVSIPRGVLERGGTVGIDGYPIWQAYVNGDAKLQSGHVKLEVTFD